MSEKVNKPTEEERKQLLTAYDEINRHWVHAEDERWSILNNFLLASTILLLAWTAVFGSLSSVPKRITLILLSVAGLTITSLWVCIASRVSIFIDLYTQVGEDVEKQLTISEGPFTYERRLREGV
jgi:hypothetical protein